MQSSIALQAAEILSALALGVCLGFLYDLMRLPRGLFPGAAWLFDVLFCLSAGAALFLLGMVCGGELRLHMPFTAAAAALAYSSISAKGLRQLLYRVEAFLRGKLKALKTLAKKLNKNLKNIFSSVEKRFRITKYTNNYKLGKHVSKSGAPSARRKGEDYEVSQSGHHSTAYYPSPSGLRDIPDG